MVFAPKARCYVLSILSLAYGITASAQDGTLDFERDIRTIFEEHCVACHGAEQAEAGVRLDGKRFAEHLGPALWKPGDPDQSPLFQRVTSTDPEFRMPPDSSGLDAVAIDRLKKWIAEGAMWPNSDKESEPADPRYDHWAWQPLRPVAIPSVPKQEALEQDHSDWATNPIDAFIMDSLVRNGLRPSPPALRREWLRRLSIDLTGLPPSYEEMERFVASQEPDAYEREVERLLASPDYGERWAQDWLDVAHYADTHGFERDQKRDHAWRYRDYVVRSFDSDKPYDQFLKEQIAGDAYWPDRSEAIIATGFLAAGPWDFVGQAETPSPQIKRQARADDLDDMLAQVMTATCGITIHCARCHNHKLDPITQREYYQMWAFFSGSYRGDRDADPAQAVALEKERNRIRDEQAAIRAQLQNWSRQLSLADMVGGGDGNGTGKKGTGIHILTGIPQVEFLGQIQSPGGSSFQPVDHPFIDGVVIPNGECQIATTGLKAQGIPKTSGLSWDAIRNGPVNAQKSTQIGSVDFQGPEHAVLGLHANAAITWDLDAVRPALESQELLFRCEIGYGGRPEGTVTYADARILLDGQSAFLAEGLNPASQRIAVALPIPARVRFLTLLSTEGTDGIGHDQIFFGDPTLSPWASERNEQERRAIESLQQRLSELQQQLDALPGVDQVYAIRSQTPATIHVLHRGSPEQVGAPVEPAALRCLVDCPPVKIDSETSDAQRRRALADWITSPSNPLPARVIVNRLWQHHFGTGIVDTPSDFGLGGGKPSHPELLDWLAGELIRCNYSLKTISRLICTSQAYRQSSRHTSRDGMAVDAQNRWIWRQSLRRLDAETIRDSVLFIAGTLQRTKFGPGYQDFDYQEEYAPIYRYRTADRPDLWRRSLYRFVVRTTPHPFLTPLDCPDPANLTPRRNVTTTAIQSLATWNHEWILQQARYMAERIQKEHSRDAWVQAAYQDAFCREPTPEERVASEALLGSDQGLADLCRVLVNSNEFLTID
ncbi:MAG: DUF1553 domain-containing protein [Pirellula sp.]|nr:DUF1553 domain-containing protein [Pirellula sp.]